MYLIDLSFTADVETLANLRPLHIAYLKPFYDAELLCVGGRKEDGTGGLILSRHTSEADVRTFMENDPFVAGGAATYQLTAFSLVMAAGAFEGLLACAV